MLSGAKLEDLEETMARIKEVQDEKDAGGVHALGANLRAPDDSHGGAERGSKGEKRSRVGRSKR